MGQKLAYSAQKRSAGACHGAMVVAGANAAVQLKIPGGCCAGWEKLATGLREAS